MKMIRAIVRPEKEEAVAEALARKGLPWMTKFDVVGRGRQRGIQVGNAVYEELAKTALLLVVDDEKVDEAVETIREAAVTGNFGDGKIFVSPVEKAWSIRTGEARA